MKDVGGAVLAGSSPPFLGRERESERAAVDVDVGPERRSPRYHETCLALAANKKKVKGGWLSRRKKMALRKYHKSTMFNGAMRRRAGPCRATQKLT